MTQLKKNSSFQWRLLLVTLFLINPMNYQSSAQELFQMMQDQSDFSVKKLERLGDKFYKNHEKGKGSGYKLYMRSLYWAKRNADANGRVISASQVVNESEKFQKSWNKTNNPTGKDQQKNNGWTELGPFNWTSSGSWNPGLGRIVSIAAEPTQQKIIFAGSPGGGIWKSVDAGKSWRPLGDRMANMSIWAIAIDPNNANIVYLGNSAGQIMKSTNGGNSWTQIYRVSGTPRRILIHPSDNRIFIGTSRALYRSTNGGSSFSSVLNSPAEDVEFKPGNTSVVYACGNSFYRSTNGGSSFSRITSGISATERMKMAVTPANPNAVYLVQKRGSGFGYLYRSLNGGSSFTTRASYNSISTNQVYFTQASRDMAIAVSDTNANEVHVGGMNFSRSLDGGASFTTLAAWNQPNDRSYVHADIEVLRYVNGTLYIGSDGGIFRSRDRGNNTTDLTQGGLAVRQYYRIGGSATDANMIVGGAQDNGTNIMNGSTRQFKEWLGADGMECFIDHKNKNVIYGTVQFGSLYKTINGGNSIANISKPGNFSGEWVTPFMMDPINNNKIYVGYRDLYRSNNGGSRGSWSNLTGSINLGGNLDEMAIAASNNNYIYIAQKGRVWRTKNGQNNTPSWTEVSGFRGDVNFITVDPNNPERVALATTGSRVYLSTNAGNTWTSIKKNLPNISAQCLVFDDTAANGLYIGMQSGVYYTNDSRSDWAPFSINLPRVQTTDLEIHYATRKIRVATYGRGIWESDLFDGDIDVEEINPPSDLASQVNQKDVTLTWKDNSTGETGFTIERTTGSTYERIGTVGTGVTTYTDNNLANDTYTYRVRAYENDNFSSYSNVVEATIEDIDIIDINPPSNLTSQVNQKDVTLTWKDNSNNELGFTIERATGNTYEKITDIESGVLTYTDKNLPNGTYKYRVNAYDNETSSSYSNVVEVTIGDIDVNTPSNLVSKVNEKDVTLTWKDNSNNENGFTIERSTGNTFERISFVGTGVTTYTDKNLANGSYTYRVNAYDTDSYSNYSNVVEATIGTTGDIDVNTPSNLVSKVNEKDVTLTWKDNSNNENGFTIERTTGNTFERIDFVGTGITTYTDKNLANGSYTYRVNAYDNDSYSNYSNTATAVIESIVTPPDVVDNCDGCIVYKTNSEETVNEDHSKELAADGNPNTYWHTNWYDDTTPHPHFINIDFGEQRDLVGFSYQGRQTGTTGMVKDYILLGWDGNNWQQLSTGTFLKSTLKQTVEFDKFRCRYVSFRALSEVDDKRWASVAEFTVRYTPGQNNPEAASKPIEQTVPPTVDLTDFDGIKVFPIPFENEVMIKGLTSKKAVRSIRLIGTNGKLQRTKASLSGDMITLDTHQLLKGFYILHIEQNGVEKNIKIFKK